MTATFTGPRPKSRAARGSVCNVLLSRGSPPRDRFYYACGCPGYCLRRVFNIHQIDVENKSIQGDCTSLAIENTYEPLSDPVVAGKSKIAQTYPIATHGNTIHRARSPRLWSRTYRMNPMIPPASIRFKLPIKFDTSSVITATFTGRRQKSLFPIPARPAAPSATYCYHAVRSICLEGNVRNGASP